MAADEQQVRDQVQRDAGDRGDPRAGPANGRSGHREPGQHPDREGGEDQGGLQGCGSGPLLHRRQDGAEQLISDGVVRGQHGHRPKRPNVGRRPEGSRASWHRRWHSLRAVPPRPGGRLVQTRKAPCAPEVIPGAFPEPVRSATRLRRIVSNVAQFGCVGQGCEGSGE